MKFVGSFDLVLKGLPIDMGGLRKLAGKTGPPRLAAGSSLVTYFEALVPDEFLIGEGLACEDATEAGLDG